MKMNEKQTFFKELFRKFNHDYFDFLSNIHRRYSMDEARVILKAYNFASNYHKGQIRKSGEPFITHPLMVAYTLAEVGFDYKTICAALLHDVVEDTSCALDKIKEAFDLEVSVLVDGVTKMKGSSFNSKQEEIIATHKKILSSITKDARIIAIKLVDRLHNMYTLEYLGDEKQIEIAKETKEFYVNLARIIGSYQIKDELQDLCLYTLNKEKFLELYELRQTLKKEHVEEFHEIGGMTKESLEKLNISMDYNIKIKNIGGIHEELIRGADIHQINDLLALRVLVLKVEDCYKALGAVHEVCTPVRRSLCDYIASPKYNGYKSLNTNVLYKDSNFQVRIRTGQMQRANELGIVSNWSEQTQDILNKKCSIMLKANKKELKKKGF